MRAHPESAISKSSSQPGRPRLHVVYFALAAFDLLTVLLSLYLFDRITDIYSDSVQINQEWAERLEDYSQLNRLAVVVNTPGNDVFTSRDVDAEAARLHEALAVFESSFQDVRSDLISNVDESQSAALLKACDAVAEAMAELVAEAQGIFDYFRGGLPDQAGERMAEMDRNYAKVNSALSELGSQVRTIQRLHFDEQTEAAASVRKGEFVIAGLIALMVLGVTLYGHNLAKRMREADQETKQHLTELAGYRQHLETLVEERTAELKASDERLRLSERLASIGTLAAGLGHDMNTVLFPVRCRLDALDSSSKDDQVHEELAAVRDSVDYLQQLSDGLRLLALDPSDEDASSAMTDLHSWWREVNALLRTSLPKNADLDAQFPESLPAVRLPPHRLTQAIFNLVGNAGEAIGEQGKVLVLAEPVDAGERIRVAVKDDGHGMTHEVRGQALDPFFTTKSRGFSTGLGLALVQGIARGAGGEVEIDSIPGQGTTVSVLLPAVKVATLQPAAAGEDRMASISLQDRRVATFVSALLRSAGYVVRFNGGSSMNDGTLWVADATADNLAGVRAFLGRSPDNQVIVFGPAQPEWVELRALIVREEDGLEGVQQAIQATSIAGMEV
jgi:signal transduction histidine kinase